MENKNRLIALALAAYACLSIIIVLAVYRGPQAATQAAETAQADAAPVAQTPGEALARLLEGETDYALAREIAVEDLQPGDDLRMADRFSDLPALERMGEDERAALVDGTQAVRRVSALGADPEDFQRPELYRKALRAYVSVCLEDIASKAKRELVYDGESLSGLNEFMAALNGQPARVAVTAEALEMDETLYVPTGILLEGNGARLVPGDATLVKAIVLDGPENCAVNGLVIEGGCDYGIYVKNAHGFQLRGNAVSGATYKGIVVMGDCDRFAIADNDVHENLNGGIFLNGNISLGLIEDNRVVDNSGARNLTAGIVLCSMEIKDIDTAYNPFEDELLCDITASPHKLSVCGNVVLDNHSSGIYSESGYMNYFVENRICGNEKEGMCLDYGSFGNYIALNTVQANGGRNRMSDEDLEADFVLAIGRLEDGSSPAKLPGISLDNTSYNTLYGNIVTGNYGSGIKAVRSAYRNLLLRNQVSDNNAGVSETFHFYGIELATDMNADEAVQGLDFTPCYENIVAWNVVSGPHYAGAFIGEEGYVNDFIGNVFEGCDPWSMECLSDRENATLNNLSTVHSRGIALSSSASIRLPESVGK